MPSSKARRGNVVMKDWGDVSDDDLRDWDQHFARIWEWQAADDDVVEQHSRPMRVVPEINQAVEELRMMHTEIRAERARRQVQ